MQQHDSRPVSLLETDLEDLESLTPRLLAAARLLRVAGGEADKQDRGVIEHIAGQVDLHVEAIQFIVARTRGEKRQPTAALRADFKSTQGKDIEDECPIDVLDAYVSCRLGSAESTLVTFNARYLEAPNRPDQVLGETFFEAGHWLNVARESLGYVVASANAANKPKLRPAA
ncbi:hypothetical protein [Modicisalibacter sp. 'Wilcox']|uniref:hypothetical protein n=1 Tax=Modicisalibacter sp. 'Wilcox' TaxID=2679914 RepID=UPI0013D7DF54|nr:hypothetical protein [Modicisalibacter sp. 'Wilcox']